MENKYVLIGQMPIKAESVTKFVTMMKNVKASEMEGCFSYVVNWDEKSVVVYEVWESKKHHDDALKDPEILALITQAMPLLDGAPTILFEGETEISL